MIGRLRCAHVVRRDESADGLCVIRAEACGSELLWYTNRDRRVALRPCLCSATSGSCRSTGCGEVTEEKIIVVVPGGRLAVTILPPDDGAEPAARGGATARRRLLAVLTPMSWRDPRRHRLSQPGAVAISASPAAEPRRCRIALATMAQLSHRRQEARSLDRTFVGFVRPAWTAQWLRSRRWSARWRSPAGRPSMPGRRALIQLAGVPFDSCHARHELSSGGLRDPRARRGGKAPDWAPGADGAEPLSSRSR